MACLGGVGAVMALGIGGLAYQPGFYREAGRAAADGGKDGQPEVLSRRLVTKASAWHAAVSAGGAWDAAVTAAEINGWLAVDLPRNHAALVPRGVAEPRVALRPKHVLCGVRLRYGPLTSVAWVDFEILLRDVNELTITVERARLGAIPLPRTAVLNALADRIGALGMVTDLRPSHRGPELVVHLPSTHDAGATSYWLQSLSISDGDLLLAGETRSTRNQNPPSPAP